MFWTFSLFYYIIPSVVYTNKGKKSGCISIARSAFTFIVEIIIAAIRYDTISFHFICMCFFGLFVYALFLVIFVFFILLSNLNLHSHIHTSCSTHSTGTDNGIHRWPVLRFKETPFATSAYLLQFLLLLCYIARNSHFIFFHFFHRVCGCFYVYLFIYLSLSIFLCLALSLSLYGKEKKNMKWIQEKEKKRPISSIFLYFFLIVFFLFI